MEDGELIGWKEAALIVAPDGEVRLVLPESDGVNDRVALLARVAARFEDPKWVASGNGGAKLVHGSGGIVSLRAEQNSAT